MDMICDDNLTGVRKVAVDLGERSYEVLVGGGLLERLGELSVAVLPGRGRVVVITDSNVGPLYSGSAVASLQGVGLQVQVVEVAAGEASKSLRCAEQVLGEMVRAGLDRHGFVVALGGGVIGDLAGFCAAIFQRGVPYVQVPTTVLSQVDSSVGGKTGVNLAEGKNLVGSFLQPSLVLADVDTLKSLEAREWNEGFAEIIKHAAIRDAEMIPLIDAVLDDAQRVGMADLIARNVAIKAGIVEADEFETRGLRALLNFGHTLGHAIEAAAGYGELLHGEAISLGLRAAAALSVRHAGLDAAAAGEIERLLRRVALPLVLGGEAAFETEALIQMARSDKKFKEGRIRFVLLRSLGDAFVCEDLTEADLRWALEGLRA